MARVESQIPRISLRADALAAELRPNLKRGAHLLARHLVRLVFYNINVGGVSAILLVAFAAWAISPPTLQGLRASGGELLTEQNSVPSRSTGQIAEATYYAQALSPWTSPQKVQGGIGGPTPDLTLPTVQDAALIE